MRKWGIILAGAMVIAASTLVLAQGGEDEGEPTDIMKTLCKDAECTEVFWEEPLDFEEFFATGMDCEEEAPGGGFEYLDTADWGDCAYVSGGSGYFIQCDVQHQHTGVAIGLASWGVGGDHIILMCYNDSGTITVGGWATFGSASALYINGTSSGDNIGIIKWANYYTDECDFENFPSTFNDSLEMDGLGGIDTIAGSQHNDSLLQGESVIGWAGNDSIALTGSSGAAWGGRDDDTITGTTGNDSIWGDDATDSIGGDDTIDGLAGDDQIAGMFDQDLIEGGQGNDTIWGYTGSDSITGGEPGSNVCYGGPDNDYCDCDVEYDCNP